MDTVQWVRQVNRAVIDSDGQFASLYRPGLKVWPIPMFGRLEEAQVLTVGVNPSCGEFEGNRWASVENDEQQTERLLRYFDHPTIPPHSWFDEWRDALNVVDASYLPGKKYLGAHIDLSPRPTELMSKVEEKLFMEMLRCDLVHFHDALIRAKQVKLVMMAGAVSSEQYVNQFVQQWLPTLSPKMRMLGAFHPYTQKGQGKVCQHRLVLPQGNIPVFFCSSSPSSGANLLASRVREHKEVLLRYLGS